MENNKLLTKAYDEGLIDVIKEWLKSQKYVSVNSIHDAFSISLDLSTAIFEELIKLELVEKESFYHKGNKVIIYNPISELKVYLLDRNREITYALTREFAPFEDVEIVLDDFAHFMDTHKSIECVVSPANSFGCMAGGYDKAITDYFGRDVEKEVQKFIRKNYYGEQPIGTSIMVDIPNADKKLIHTPTMRLPSPIKDPLVIYQCMRSTIMVALRSNIHSIVIPAFGGATGQVPPRILAKYMKEGYKQVIKFLKIWNE